jgi:hypothetical protein
MEPGTRQWRSNCSSPSRSAPPRGEQRWRPVEAARVLSRGLGARLGRGKGEMQPRGETPFSLSLSPWTSKGPSMAGDTARPVPGGEAPFATHRPPSTRHSQEAGNEKEMTNLPLQERKIPGGTTTPPSHVA